MSVGERLLVHAEERVHGNVFWVHPPSTNNSTGLGVSGKIAYRSRKGGSLGLCINDVRIAHTNYQRIS